jgi:hypothetical protein
METAVNSIGTVEDRHGDQRVAARRLQRNGPRATAGPGSSRRPPEDGRHTAPFSHFTMDVFLRGQAGTLLQQEPLKDGCWRRDFGRNRNCNDGYRNKDFNEQLRLRMNRTLERMFRQALALQILTQQSRLTWRFEQWVTGHWGGVGPFRSKRRSCRQLKN